MINQRRWLAAALGLGLVAGLAGGLTGCAGEDRERYLRVTVAFDATHFGPGNEARSRCVRVYVRGEGTERWTAPMRRTPDAPASRLVVGIARDDLPDAVWVGAIGYVDDACTTETAPPERTEPVWARFPPASSQTRVADLELSIRRVPPGIDGGVLDAGGDAGLDGGDDAGTLDAGDDAGTLDAGDGDAGLDAGMPDAGDGDAGLDAGAPDAGPDAGTPDAGFDAGSPFEAFPYQPANVPGDVLDLVLDAGLNSLVIEGCDLQIDTSTAPPTLAGDACSTPPATHFVALRAAQAGSGQEAAFFGFSGLSIDRDAGLLISGRLPAILLVRGDAHVAGRVTALPTAEECPPVTELAVLGSGAGGRGGGYGTTGGNGGAAASGQPGADGGAAASDLARSLRPLRLGCGGGPSGDTGAPSSGGLGGGALQLSASGTILIAGSVAAPGQGGRGGAASAKGGAGGGSGGALLLEARRIVVDGGAVTANGGGGGAAGDDTSAGPSGADGSPSTSTPAAGGSLGGPPFGSGGNGAAGNQPAATGADGKSTGGAIGGGGGGGGLGLVRLDALEGCTFTGGALLSGVVTSSLTDGGCLGP